MIPSLSPSKSPDFLAAPLRASARTLNAVAAFVRAAWKARRHRRDVARLLHLDDTGLADIGLTRADVAWALAGAPFDDPSTRLRVMAVERRAARRAMVREGLAGLAGERGVPRPSPVRIRDTIA